MKALLFLIAGGILACLPTVATAETLAVDDASRLKWSISSGKVYFRNFNEIDATWQGCCYVYYIDLSTDEGKAMFSLFLTRHSARQPLNFWVANKTANPTPIGQMGDW